MAELTRRELLRRGAAAGAALAAGPALGGWSAALGAPRPHDPRVAIVGAGLAGLACADRLQRAGVRFTIFEANPIRIGGRCWSSRGWADGQVAEHGGEFLDSIHVRMRALAKRFGLELEDLATAPLPGSSRLWLKRSLRRFEPLAPERAAMVAKLERAARRLGPYGFRHPSRAAREMDEMTVADWLDEHVPGGGSGSLLGRQVGTEMASEFGLDPSRLSALNLLYEYVEAPAGADERFHVAGGNDQIVAGLAEGLPEGSLVLDAPLQRLSRHRGRYSLRAGDEEHRFDRVVLALPFTRLREVDLSGAGLSRHKRRCIDELGMGTNAKAIFQASRRPNAYAGWNGYLLADGPRFVSWESSAAQPGSAGLITTYYGGVSGSSGLRPAAPHGPAGAGQAARILGLYERAGLAPIAAEQIGEVRIDRWARDPYVLGSYAAFLPGQYTRFYGFAGRPEGGIHFAGEHTATVFQGYLEGAVQSGQRAAREVAKALRA
jgi:monoamine oxidase